MLRPAPSAAPTGKAGAETAPRDSKAAAGSLDDDEDVWVGAACSLALGLLSCSARHAHIGCLPAQGAWRADLSILGGQSFLCGLRLRGCGTYSDCFFSRRTLTRAKVLRRPRGRARRSPQSAGGRSWGRGWNRWAMRSRKRPLAAWQRCCKAPWAMRSWWRSPAAARQVSLCAVRPQYSQCMPWMCTAHRERGNRASRPSVGT